MLPCWNKTVDVSGFSALTEKIVAVLPRMKCPHRIEPHQIQGLDFIHIYPVVQVSAGVLNINQSLKNI